LEYTEEVETQFAGGPMALPKLNVRTSPILVNGTSFCTTTCPQWVLKDIAADATDICTCTGSTLTTVLYRYVMLV